MIRISAPDHSREPGSSRIKVALLDFRSGFAGFHHSRNQPFAQVSGNLGQWPVTVIMDEMRRVLAPGQLQQLMRVGGKALELVAEIEVLALRCRRALNLSGLDDPITPQFP